MHETKFLPLPTATPGFPFCESGSVDDDSEAVAAAAAAAFQDPSSIQLSRKGLCMRRPVDRDHAQETTTP